MYDLAVIGGGVNGCGIARDAVGRGTKVLLLERGDLASGTSSASTKLIHGGLRYLEHAEFALVREALQERERLWRIAPHLIHPMRFVLPYRKGLRPRWMLRLGLFIYDHLGGHTTLPGTATLDLRTHPAGAPLKPGYRHGYAYSDGRVDDARLVVLNALDAAERGATIETRTEVTRLVRENDGWTITAHERTFRARAVVNAAGPFVLDLLHDAHQPTDRRMRFVRGSHIVVPRLFGHGFAYFFQLPDGRIFFGIPYERDFTLIGTTDRDQESPERPPKVSDEEIRYLCDAANQYFARSIGPGDVVWSYAGVRPLVDDGSGKPEAATRGYRLELDGGDGVPVLLSVFGGKITTYRHLAAEAVDLLAEHLDMLQGGDWTATEPLPGGDFPTDKLPALEADLARNYPFLKPETIERVAKAYGTRARCWLKEARSLDDLGTHFGHGLTAAEVDYLIATEWAQAADDVLWRRTKLGLRLDADEVATLKGYMAERA